MSSTSDDTPGPALVVDERRRRLVMLSDQEVAALEALVAKYQLGGVLTALASLCERRIPMRGGAAREAWETSLDELRDLIDFTARGMIEDGR
jgi:hypothetical protein